MHVWRARLDPPDDSLMAVLSPEERERAARFHFERDRSRFAMGRGYLRALLGRYVGCAPEQIVFRYGQRGKPSLAADATGLEFNAAHSHDVALFAFALGAPVGVDVELVRPGPAEEGIADRFFSPLEAEALRSLPEAERREAFFRCWTRKEAFVKANGEGLTYGLDQFTVSLSPDEPARLVDVARDPREADAWSLHHVDPGDSYIGAVAVRGRVERLCLYGAPQEPTEMSPAGE